MNEIVSNWTLPGEAYYYDGLSFRWESLTIIVLYFVVGYLLSLLISKFGGFKSFQTISKREKIGRILGLGVAVGLLMSCVGKTVCYIKPELNMPMVPRLTSFGLAWMIPAIYAAEILSAVCLFSKTYYKLGVWAAACTTTGAVTAHMPLTADGPYWAIASGTLLVMTFLSALLYAPEMFPEQITKRFSIKHTESK